MTETTVQHLFIIDKINEQKTINKAKVFLKEYERWHLQKDRLEKWRHLSKSPFELTTTISSEQIAKVNLECDLRLHTLDTMRETADNLKFLADVLELRYIKSIK